MNGWFWPTTADQNFDAVNLKLELNFNFARPNPEFYTGGDLILLFVLPVINPPVVPPPLRWRQ